MTLHGGEHHAPRIQEVTVAWLSLQGFVKKGFGLGKFAGLVEFGSPVDCFGGSARRQSAYGGDITLIGHRGL
jgi:hypothetical protein